MKTNAGRPDMNADNCVQLPLGDIQHGKVRRNETSTHVQKCAVKAGARASRDSEASNSTGGVL